MKSAIILDTCKQWGKLAGEMKTQVDTTDETYDYILTDEDRERFNPCVDGDQYWDGEMWLCTAGWDYFSDYSYRRKKAVQADQWREIDASEMYLDVWCWNTQLGDFRSYQSNLTGITLLSKGYTHWQPANPPRVGPRAKTQEERDREAGIKDFMAKCGEDGQQSDKHIAAFLAGVKYAREPQP